MIYFTNETGSCKTTVQFWQKVHGVDITHDNVCSVLSCFYLHLLSTGRPISSFYLKDLTWSDNNNNMYLGPVVAAQQVLDPSPQTSYPRKEKRGGAYLLQPSLQESKSQGLGISLPHQDVGEGLCIFSVYIVLCIKDLLQLSLISF